MAAVTSPYLQSLTGPSLERPTAQGLVQARGGALCQQQGARRVPVCVPVPPARHFELFLAQAVVAVDDGKRGPPQYPPYLEQGQRVPHLVRDRRGRVGALLHVCHD